MKHTLRPVSAAVLQALAAIALTACGGESDSARKAASGADARPAAEPAAANGEAHRKTVSSTLAAADAPIPAVPYALPADGVAVAIGTNEAASVRPPEIGAFNWGYSLFQSFGSGTFVPDFSAPGAFVIAASGGHNVAPVLDAVVFDFADATWKRVRNANGIAPRDGDYDVSETTGAPYFEVKGAAAGQVPAPPHLYALATYIPAAQGGGPRGSYLKMGSPAATIQSGQGGGIHKMDLSTGLWTRVTNDTLSFSYNYEASTVFDPGTSRYYFIPDGMHAFDALQYLDLSDQRVKKTPTFPWQPTINDSAYQTTFLDPVRRLIVAQRPGSPLRALDLNDIAAGWRILSTSGTQPDRANRWFYYPVDGRFYTHTNNGGQTLYRMTPPQDWKTGTWVVDTVTVSGEPLPNYIATAGGGVRHYGTFFYVPALRSFAWIAGDTHKVILMRPPAAPAGPARPRAGAGAGAAAGAGSSTRTRTRTRTRTGTRTGTRPSAGPGTIASTVTRASALTAAFRVGALCPASGRHGGDDQLEHRQPDQARVGHRIQLGLFAVQQLRHRQLRFRVLGGRRLRHCRQRRPQRAAQRRCGGL
jgi:hypothetical protein